VKLEYWRPNAKGALLGRASVLLSCGLKISDIGIFCNHNGRWAKLPSELMRDADGRPLKDPVTGKARYRSPLKWSTRELQERFSETLIGLIESEHGRL